MIHSLIPDFYLDNVRDLGRGWYPLQDTADPGVKDLHMGDIDYTCVEAQASRISLDMLLQHGTRTSGALLGVIHAIWFREHYREMPWKLQEKLRNRTYLFPGTKWGTKPLPPTGASPSEQNQGMVFIPVIRWKGMSCFVCVEMESTWSMCYFLRMVPKSSSG